MSLCDIPYFQGRKRWTYRIIINRSIRKTAWSDPKELHELIVIVLRRWNHGRTEYLGSLG
jgi:hypothetical protein